MNINLEYKTHFTPHREILIFILGLFNLFNKKFSLATHNALKSGLKKMGATSLKFISNVAIVFVELVTLTIDYSTWKGKLIGKIDVAVDDWSNQSLDAIKKDLLKLKDENIDILRNIWKEKITK